MRIDRLSVIITVVFLFVTVGCGGPEERKAKYLTRAQGYIQNGNFPKARVALRNVLKIDPKDPEAFYLFAEVEEKEKNWRDAFMNYRRVVELVPDHERALIKLGRFYLEARETEKVLEIADKVLAKTPGHVQAEALRISVRALKGELDEAARDGESLVAQHPTEPDAAILLAAIYTLQKRFSEVEPVLRRAMEAHPRDPDLLSALASGYIRSGNTLRAEQALKQMIDLEPKLLDYRMRLTEFYDQQKEYDKAEAVLRETVRLDPENEQRRLVLADFLATRRGVAQAEATLVEAQRSLPHTTAIQFALGKLYEMGQQAAKARITYEEIRDKHRAKPAGLEAKVKLAALDWSEGKQAEAKKQLQEVLKENPRSADALLLLGKIALRLGDGKGAVQSFRTVLKDQPELAEAYALLGQAHITLNEMSLARESLEKAVALNPRMYDAHVALAGLDASSGKPQDARRRLEVLLKLDPNNFGALGLLLNLQAADRDWASTDQTLARLRSSGANSLVADLTEGHLYETRQEWDKALAAYDRAAAANPEAPEPLLALTRLETQTGRVAQAQGRLERVMVRNPKHAIAHGLLGEVVLLKGDGGLAEREFQEATRLKPDWPTPWLDWTMLKLSQNKQDEARQILARGLDSNPNSEELRLFLATSLMEAGHADRAIQEYEAILRNNPRALLAANNLAALLTDYKGDPKSLERALSLCREFEIQSSNPVFLDTLGWVHLKLGHADEAIRLIRQAVAKAPDHPVLNYHLGTAYSKAGQVKEARAHLEKAVSSKQPFTGREEARAVLSSLKG